LDRRSSRIHLAIYERSAGRLGGHLPGWPEARILLRNDTGAKTGRKRTSPLMYHEDGDAYAVVASKGGQSPHPAGYEFFERKAKPRTIPIVILEPR
jgi:F420H(2)-dependent quinone reductase